MLTVIESIGSSPGRQGFKMLVAQDGFIWGSIGGGVMEHALVTEAKDLLQQKNAPFTVFKKQVHRKKAQAGSGMICSGEQSVVFHLLDKKSVAIIEMIIEILDSNQKGLLTLSDVSFEVEEEKIPNKFYCKITKYF